MLDPAPGAAFRADYRTIPAEKQALFLDFISLSVLNGSSRAIWQSKTAPHVQGRVFAVRRMIACASLPLAYLVAGPLADRVFEPWRAAWGDRRDRSAS
jgi:hypothetical protein